MLPRPRLQPRRLLVRPAAVAVLDEPTEHLDGPTADALTRTLSAALRDRTVLLITHRLIGLEQVDRIIELDDGRVRASGTHDELMALDGWYAQQWRLESERRDMSSLLADLPVGRGVAGPAATSGS